MNKRKPYGSLVFLFLLTFSCQKELYFDQEPTNSAGSNQWSFADSSSGYGGNIDSALNSSFPGQYIISLFGTSSDGKGKFYVEILSSKVITTGIYEKNKLAFRYVESSGLKYLLEPADPESFTLQVTALDSTEIRGTFSGWVRGPGNQKRYLDEGRFLAKLTVRNSSVIPQGYGQITLWAKSGCGGSASPVTVKIGEQVAAINRFYDTEPACGAPGTAIFALPAGSYTVTYFCGSDSFQSGLTIVEGKCLTQEFSPCQKSQSTCRLLADTLFAPQVREYSGWRSVYNGNQQVEKVEQVNFVTDEVLQQFNLSYTPLKIVINNTDHFDLDGCGRAIAYIGYPIPGDELSGPLQIIRYSYDILGYLTGIKYAFASSPSETDREYKFRWENGNLVSGDFQDFSNHLSTTYTYEYYDTLTAKDFLSILPDETTLLFQTALSFGKPNRNLIYKINSQTYPEQGSSTTQSTFFTRYSLDNEGRVKDLVISGDRPVFYHQGTHYLSYQCF